MNKLLKKLSISQTIIYLSLLAIIFSSGIGILGYFDMKQLNATTKDMNANVTLPMSYIESLRTDSLNVQLCVAKSNANYDAKYETTINELDVRINKSLKSYLSTDLDTEEKVGLKKFDKDYTDYLTLWNKVSPELAKNGRLSPEDIRTFDSLGDDMESTLKGLNDYNIKWAGIWASDNNALFKSSTERYVMIDSIIVLVFMLITFIVIKFIKRSSKETIDYLDVISQGDFTKKITDDSKNEFATIKHSIAKTVHNISLLIESIKDKSINIEQGSIELSSLSEEMAVSSDNVVKAISQTVAGTDSQANDLLDITDVLEKFSLELETMVKAIEDIDSNAKDINSMANENHEDLQSLVKSVGRINDSFKEFAEKISHLGQNIAQINEITNVINGIAEQTNLLALNASIEAARAGESGKGFSIVAEEIGKLAEQSKISSENITNLITNISEESNNMLKSTDVMSNELNCQVSTINTSIESFKKIITAVEEVIPKIQTIDHSAVNINNDKKTIQQKIQGASALAEEVSASSQEINASAEEMNACSEHVASTANVFKALTVDMMEDVSKFKLD